MREILDQLEGLIQFKGLNFRETVVACQHCDWSGTGGSLEVPDLALSGQKVNYACPGCMEIIAVHNGLTDREVMQEMEKIRGILAEEMLTTKCQEPKTDSGHKNSPIEFSAIRTQIKTVVENQNESEQEAAENLAIVASDDSDVPELDFDFIRARLGAIA
jgi:hypothetical protein